MTPELDVAFLDYHLHLLYCCSSGPLPRGFVALEARGTRELACTTHELNALNTRLKDAANDCMLLTEQVQAA